MLTMEHTGTGIDLAGDLAATAEWRLEKAEEYPGDERNAKAAEELSELAEGVVALGRKKHPLIVRYNALFDSVDDDTLSLVEIQFQMLDCIGFVATYESAEELLTDLLTEFDRLDIPPSANDNTQGGPI